LFIELIIVQ